MGGEGEQTVGGEKFSCGARELVALAEYDPVLQAVTKVTDVNAGVTEVWYDGFGRMKEMFAPSPAKYGQQRYDAFGRAVETQGLDGTVTLLTRFHALSADAWDAEDLGPGPHQGTYASEKKDGHGRVTRTTERVHGENGLIEERHVEMTYLPTGEPLSITRRKGEADCVTSPSDCYARRNPIRGTVPKARPELMAKAGSAGMIEHAEWEKRRADEYFASGVGLYHDPEGREWLQNNDQTLYGIVDRYFGETRSGDDAGGK